MPEIKFYYAPGACSLAPHILLREAGLEFEGIEVRSENPQSSFPEQFRLINPKMQVPVISVDGEIITESPAVATIISSLVPEKHLMGRTPLETARVYEWMNWLSGTLHMGGFGHLIRPYRWSDDPAAFEGIKAKAMERVVGCFEAIEGKLGGGFAVGEGFTAVDPYLLTFYRWANSGGMGIKEKYPKYTAFVEKLVQRDAVKLTLTAEGIDSTL